MNHTLAELRNPVLPPALGSGSTERGGTIIGSLISNIVGLLFIFAFLLTLLYLIMGGIQWLTSGGEKAQLEQARNKITNALVGLVIVAAAYAIFTLVGQFLGIDIKALIIPSFKG
ncbi:MAG: hypothetical protein V1917_03165 [Candidatus Gottesmanbacteria bacterium]